MLFLLDTFTFAQIIQCQLGSNGIPVKLTACADQFIHMKVIITMYNPAEYSIGLDLYFVTILAPI